MLKEAPIRAFSKTSSSWKTIEAFKACLCLNEISEQGQRRRLAGLGNQEAAGNFSIKRRQLCAGVSCQFHQMAVGRLLRTFDPLRKMRDVVPIRNEGAANRIAGFE